jgi:poly [ADP-ribose] polymerase
MVATFRSMCKGCKKAIGQGSVRVAKMVNSPFFDGLMPLWHHKACLAKKFTILSAAFVEGLDELKWEDQEKIRAMVSSDGGEKPAEEVAAMMAADEYRIEYAKSGRHKHTHAHT